jgi:hypothetical protein
MHDEMHIIQSPVTRLSWHDFLLAPLQGKPEDGRMETRIHTLLAQLPKIGKIRTQFFLHIVTLFLSIPGRIHFLNMARYGIFSEKTYRSHFEQPFAFWDFNAALIQQVCGSHRIIAGDCTYLPKSGKHTPHLGTFWNGCVGKAMPGLELSSLAVVDVNHHTAFHLFCQQTPGHLTDQESRVDFYVKQITSQARALKALADYVVYDGAAGKKKFVDGIVEQTDLHLISKLRKDADLRYLYKGPRHTGPGRPKTYDGKMNCPHPDLSRFEQCYTDDQKTIYTAVVNSKRFKRNIRIAYITYTDREEYTMLFSTDLELDGYRIYLYYHLRFQIEFLFRDAKQHTGLGHCQARSEHKLSFHHNVSLTAVSLAKADFYSKADNQGKPFSIADIKRTACNQLYLDHIFQTLELDPRSETIAPYYHELLNFGRAVA